MIEINRVSRLLIKNRFLARHRRILNYSHQYVITSDDIDRPIEVKSEKKEENDEVEQSLFIDQMLDGFDAETNEIDRRLYYEVTGRQLVEGEFGGDDGGDTSDGEWANLNKPDPLAYAFNYKGSNSSSEDENQQ